MAFEYNQIVPVRRSQSSPLGTALAGMAASIPMGLVMMGLNRYLPRQRTAGLPLDQRRVALPPKQITRRAARKVGVEDLTVPGRTWGPATWLAHLGYGAAVASLFPLATRPLRLPAVARGIVFGMAVWAASYQGWLPAARLQPPASETPARRNAVMVLSHLLWGGLIGLAARQQERKITEDFTI